MRKSVTQRRMQVDNPEKLIYVHVYGIRMHS